MAAPARPSSPPSPARALLGALALAAPAAAQELEAGGAPVADLVTGLSFLTLSEDLTGIRARIENDAPGADDTRLDVYKVYWQRDVDVGSEHGELYLEAAASLLNARDRLTLPLSSGDATVKETWSAYGGLLGAGWSFPLAEDWRLRPAVGFVLTRIENDARYSGPGAAELDALVDGLYTNFDGWSATRLASLALLHERPLGPTTLRAHARHTWAHSEVYRASSEFQEGDASSRYVSLRADLDGLLPWHLRGGDVGWNLFGSHERFFDGDRDVLGFDEVWELGGALRFPVIARLPAIELAGGALFGPDVRGWTLGLSVSF